MVDSPSDRDRVDPCPLCHATEAASLLSVPYEGIWNGLRKEWSARFTQDVIRRHQPVDDAVLYRCSECGLEYFSPVAPGDAEFYEQLMASTPYHRDRWEFELVEGFINPGDRVADLGCGDGAFLLRICDRVGRAVGVDLSSGATRSLAARGVEAHSVDFMFFAASEREAFDVVCSFHTLEHLASVDPLVGAAALCVRPGGRIFVSVPNRLRYGRSVTEPLDCPPHHISRWSAAQMPLLADRFGLELTSIWFEQPDYSHAWLACRARIRPVLDRIGARDDRSLAVRAVMKALMGEHRYSRLARRRAFTRNGLFGHSVLAELRRPATSGSQELRFNASL